MMRICTRTIPFSFEFLWIVEVSGSLKDELDRGSPLRVVCGDLNDEPNKKRREKEHPSNTSDLRNDLGQAIHLELQTRVL